MSMYDDLDPMFPPAPEAALEHVAARVHALRVRRRVTIGGALGAIAVVIALTSLALTSGASGHAARVSVSDDPTTTTRSSPSSGQVPPAASGGATTTSRPRISTSAPSAPKQASGPGPGVSVPPGQSPPDSISGSGTISTGPAPSIPSRTTTTVGETTTTVGSSGPGQFRVAFDVASLTLRSGTTATVSYTITNVGDTTGYLYVSPCTSDQELWPTPPGLWPDTVSPNVVCAAAIERIPLAPGASAGFSHKLVAGRYSGANIVPAYPGSILFTPPELSLPRPTTLPLGSLRVTITPPATAPFTANRPTSVTGGSGTEVLAPFSLTNNLPFAASYQFVGPRTRPPTSVGTGGGSCVGDPNVHHFSAFRCTYTVGGSTTIALELDLWATDNLLPPDPPGVLPLAPGAYSIAWNEISLRLTVT